MKSKVAIIHDWLNGMRGGEKVLEDLLVIFPQADVFTLFLEEENISDRIKSHKIIPSSLNRYRFIRKYYRHFLPLFPSAIEEFNLREYDVVISSSHCVAKGIIPHPDSLHISYIYSPMRYIWDQYYPYFGNMKGLKKYYIKRHISRLRTWDVTSASRVDHFVAISRLIQERIWRYYRRTAAIIHPPVDTATFQPAPNPERNYFLTVSALVPYKAHDLLVEAFNQTGDPLVIVGKGSEEKKLRRIARENIVFKKDLPQEELVELYRNAIAFVFAGVEDFGIAFVEAQACGTPVVAYKKGGVMDIVGDGTGILFNHQTTDDLIDAVYKIKRTNFEPSFLRENSLNFSRENFRTKFKNYVDQMIKEAKQE